MIGGHPIRSDSGFVSAGTGAGTGANRVRFSPSPFDGPSSSVAATAAGQGIVMQTDWSPTHPVADPAPAARSSRPSRSSQHHHYITESDLQRDFNIYP